MNYFQTIPLGFDKDAIAIVDDPSDSLSLLKHAYFKQTILQGTGRAQCQPLFYLTLLRLGLG